MKEYGLKDLGKRIQTARKAKNKTQDDVAAAIGVNKITVSDWERGIKQPGFLNILNYCNFLGITLDELVEFKKQQYLLILLTSEERDNLLARLEACQREARQHQENTPLHQNLDVLEQHIHAVLSRAQYQ